MLLGEGLWFGGFRVSRWEQEEHLRFRVRVEVRQLTPGNM